MQRGLISLRMRVRHRQALVLQQERVVAKTVRNVLAHIIRKWKEKSMQHHKLRVTAQKIVHRLKHSCLSIAANCNRKERIAGKTKSLRIVNRFKNRCMLQMKNKALRVVQRMLNGALVSTFER